MAKKDFSEFEHNLSDSQIIDIFESFCIGKGLIFSGKDSQVIADGRTHYLKVINRSNKNKNKKSGWYKLDLTGDIAKGSCGWYHGDNLCFSWHLYYDYIAQNKDNNSIRFKKTDELFMIQRQEEREEQLIEQRIKEQLILNTAKVYTAFEMFRSVPTKSHPYLLKKKIDVRFVRTLNPSRYTEEELVSFVEENYPQLYKNELIKQIMNWQELDDERVFYDRNQVLIIPGFDFNMEYRTFQYILPKPSRSGRQKLFLGAAGAKSGSFSFLYDYDLPNPDRTTKQRFIVCEGWATGVALYFLTKGSIPIIIAWDAGNIIPVCRLIRNTYYSANIYICGDNDHDSFNKNLGMVVNAGYNHAIRAASMVAAVVALPPFRQDVPDHKDLSDWDDYLEYAGFQAAQDALRAAMRTPIIYANYNNKENQLIHRPVQWLERTEHINKTNYPVSTCGFTRYLKSQIKSVRMGLNDSLNDLSVDSIIHFNMESQPHYDFVLQDISDNPARKLIDRHLNMLINNLVVKAILETDIRSLIPDVSEILDIIQFFDSQIVADFKKLIVVSCNTYNSEAWIDSVFSHLFEQSSPTKLISRTLIDKLKENDIFFDIPKYRCTHIDCVKNPIDFTKYWLWYLNLSIGKDTPRLLSNLTQAQFIKNYESHYQNRQIDNLLIDLDRYVASKPHQSIDGSLHLMINDLHEQMIVGGVEDIRFYEDHVVSGFNMFAKFPPIVEIFKNSVVAIFAQQASLEWSTCIVDNMWDKYQKTQAV